MTTPVTIIGNVVADVEPRISQAGKPWCSVRVASQPREKDRQTGEWKDGESMFVSIPLFGDYADHAVQSLGKGTRIIATGKLRQRSYTDNNGNERQSLEMYDVEGIGAELRFATATVQRAQKPGSNASSGQGWGNVSPAQNQAVSGGFGGQPAFNDEEPF